ncbi:MAG: hypothetical protein MUP92_01365 [Actinobacteria bacterium]|nr:hypothetical protein [Actinomycetota bacterium]
MVMQAKAMPLSSSVLLNRDELLDLVKEMRILVPDEIKQARFVVRDREELLANARVRAEEIVEAARTEQTQLTSEESVVAAAHDEAGRIVADAEEQAHRVRRETDDYVDSRLEQLESVLRRANQSMKQADEALESTTGQVSRGRRHLRGEET